MKAGVKKIVHASSIAAYGAFKENPIPITEEYPIRIMKKKFYYNETKVLAEQHLDKIEKENPNIIITRFRPPVIIGPQLGNKMVAAMFKKKVLLTKSPEDPMQFIHVITWFHCGILNS